MGELSDKEIIAAHVVQPEMHRGSIQLAEYDPSWPRSYAALARGIRDGLGDKVLRLEHVGSTSIPGLAAKPTIDLVLAVADPQDESAYMKPLEERGYTLKIRERHWYEHRLLNPPNIAGNLHVFGAGCVEIDKMVLFRDWLRSHAQDRVLYEKTKRELAKKTWKFVQNYADAKSVVVEGILSRAGWVRG
jgi:GrpB-like predicted nucleotidyltransferase (UPF0157 family)